MIAFFCCIPSKVYTLFTQCYYSIVWCTILTCFISVRLQPSPNLSTKPNKTPIRLEAAMSTTGFANFFLSWGPYNWQTHTRPHVQCNWSELGQILKAAWLGYRYLLATVSGRLTRQHLSLQHLFKVQYNGISQLILSLFWPNLLYLQAPSKTDKLVWNILLKYISHAWCWYETVWPQCLIMWPWSPCINRDHEYMTNYFLLLRFL